MRKPYRVIVWGPGSVGRACLKEVLKRPEFELVGVLAYNPEKNGKDVGELLGMAPIGLKATTNKEEIFALDADVVLYAGSMPSDTEGTDRDIIRVLESGKHVITAVMYHYPPYQGPAYLERFESACHRGKSCLHGTGENPGFWFERVALTLTGICTEVEHLKLEEFVDCAKGGSTAEVLTLLGFNRTMEEAQTGGGGLEAMWKRYYFVETLSMASMTLHGRPLDRIDHEQVYYPAEEDIVLIADGDSHVDMTVKKGNTRAIRHIFTGYLDGDAKLSIVLNWFLRPQHSPFDIKVDNFWQIELEGKPISLRVDVSAFASLKGNLESRPGDPTTSAWYATAVPMVQAIPIVCAHEPGIVYPSIFTTCVPDFRVLETRKSVVA